MRMFKRIAVLALMLILPLAVRSQMIIEIPLSLSGTNPFVWTNAVWWTNASVPTNIETWQAWWAVNTNFGNLAAGKLRITNGSWIGSNSWQNMPTLAHGDNFYASSNGVPHVIWKNEAGTLYTNRLVP